MAALPGTAVVESPDYFANGLLNAFTRLKVTFEDLQSYAELSVLLGREDFIDTGKKEETKAAVNVSFVIDCYRFLRS